ncbi:type VI secretion system baseplate subunit TssE [Luteimonas terrae]|uniref:Type VI secretion system protein ImpF n=1 Tax=Luteimonas terrae TaxID=1530191 RepID=A0ABU1XV52_9GAMM|nr:type VI secretion system baseplate subunit TssE [Luteimonas terrae]MDR7192649.1 type VI secretion system protein ImpF [Luteimonas terrae]
MKGFEPSLLEKLFDEAPRSPGRGNVLQAVSVEQYKESVANDLEGLLNSRAAFGTDALSGFPNCCQSLLTYGLVDFSSMSLANAYDRAAICRSIEQAISRHETRLHDVHVTLDANPCLGAGLHFTINALLDLQPAKEAVSFDALLQPSTLQYSVSRMRRQAAVV